MKVRDSFPISPLVLSLLDYSYNYSSMEEGSAHFDRALKHYMIAVRGGLSDSLEAIKELYTDGYASPNLSPKLGINVKCFRLKVYAASTILLIIFVSITICSSLIPLVTLNLV